MVVADMKNVFGMKATIDFETPRARLVFEGDGDIIGKDGDIITSGDFTITVALDEKQREELKQVI